MIFAGQVIVGSSLSFTVTVKLHVAVLPLASVTVKLLIVVPTAKADPLVKPAVWVVVNPAQLSLDVTVYGRLRTGATRVRNDGDIAWTSNCRQLVVVHCHRKATCGSVTAGIRYGEAVGGRPDREGGSAGQTCGLGGRESSAVVVGGDRVGRHGWCKSRGRC